MATPTRKTLSLNDLTFEKLATGIVKFDANDAAPDYIGIHTSPGAATTDIHWKIIKFTYSGSDVTQIQIVYGAWDDRATLFS
jgi:hypothetical protein